MSSSDDKEHEYEERLEKKKNEYRTKRILRWTAIALEAGTSGGLLYHLVKTDSLYVTILISAIFIKNAIEIYLNE